MHNRGNAIDGRSIDGGALQRAFALLAAFFAFASGNGVLAAGAFALQDVSLHRRERWLRCRFCMSLHVCAHQINPLGRLDEH